jgi:hypothetical protein
MTGNSSGESPIPVMGAPHTESEDRSFGPRNHNLDVLECARRDEPLEPIDALA